MRRCELGYLQSSPSYDRDRTSQAENASRRAAKAENVLRTQIVGVT
jgi:hypothetical protein